MLLWQCWAIELHFAVELDTNDGSNSAFVCSAILCVTGPAAICERLEAKNGNQGLD